MEQPKTNPELPAPNKPEIKPIPVIPGLPSQPPEVSPGKDPEPAKRPEELPQKDNTVSATNSFAGLVSWLAARL